MWVGTKLYKFRASRTNCKQFMLTAKQTKSDRRGMNENQTCVTRFGSKIYLSPHETNEYRAINSMHWGVACVTNSSYLVLMCTR